MVLAGLASCPDRTVLVPLRRRAATVLARGPREGVQRGWLRGQLARLVLAAAGETPAGLPVADVTQAFLVSRLAEVERVLAGAEPPFTPLATPDSPGGFVDPRALLARLAGEPRPRHHDLVAALLRLGADGRDEALAGSVAARIGRSGGRRAPARAGRPRCRRRRPVGGAGGLVGRSVPCPGARRAGRDALGRRSGGSRPGPAGRRPGGPARPSGRRTRTHEDGTATPGGGGRWWSSMRWRPR